MKNKGFLIIGFFLLFSNLINSKEIIASSNIERQDSITVFCSEELSVLTNTWAEEYNKLNSDLLVNVRSLPESGAEGFYSDNNLGFFSQKDFIALDNEALWKVVVGRDVLIPIINSKNPFLEEISAKGLSADELAMIYSDPSNASWGELFGNSKNKMVTAYFINNEKGKTDVAKFLNTDKGLLNGINVENGKALVSAVQNDPLALGFCKLSDVLDPANQQFADNIRLLPIDRNANNKIDYAENIYQDLNAFSRGVWIGKYPKALYTNIFTVSAAKPGNPMEVAFLKWVLTDGQQFITPNGFTDLAIHERQSRIDDLTVSSVELIASTNEKSNLKMILLILALTVVFSFALEAIFRYRKSTNGVNKEASFIHEPALSINTLTLPAGLYFDKSHTWAFMEKDGLVRIGIDDFLQHVIGSISQIKMKGAGEKISKGDIVMTIVQKGKQLNIYSPVSGIIIESNESLEDEASLLNTSPFTEGWIYSIQPTNWIREIQFLRMSEKYKLWISEEFTRLRDFLAVFVKPGTVEYSHVILQDGGELKDNLLSDLGPEAWEDFQTNFLDNSK